MITHGDNGDLKSRVLAATDLVELVGRSVKLKRVGKDYKGLCPFHQEKTASFKVDPAKQFFHCFGCKATGNAIDFVMKRDRIEFRDALRLLAEAAGIEVAKFGISKQKTGEKQLLLDANSAACSYFEKSLAHPQLGAAARAYLAQRGINDDSVRRFQIGLAPEGWDGLLKSPLVKKFTHMRFEPAGFTKNPEIPIAKSLVDYVFRWLGSKFLSAEEKEAIGIIARDSSSHAPVPMTEQTVVSRSAGSSPMPFAFATSADAPACHECGSIMVRNAACYKCLNCGATSGCS